ncbi:histidine phosphatase family protein [Angustibacter peucedani]
MLLLRHGQTQWNADGRFQGQTDIDLDDVGRLQAERAASELARLSPSAIVSSDLRRARDTAFPLGQLTGLPVTTDARLRETYAGQWQGMLAADIQEAFPDLRAAWRAGEDVRPGGDGERRVEVGARVAAAVDEHAAQLPDDGLLVVVTHGGSIATGVQTLLGVPPECWPVVSGVGNCHWSVLTAQRAGGWVLEEHNAFSLPEEVVGDES